MLQQRIKITIPFILVCLILLMGRVKFVYPQSDQTVQLGYDDGEPNLKLSLLTDASTFTTRFTPPSNEVKIQKILYYIADTTGGTSFSLFIYNNVADEPGMAILGPVSVVGGKMGWNEFDLTDWDLTVEGDFYISLQYDQMSKLTLGAENRQPLSGRTYDTDC